MNDPNSHIEEYLEYYCGLEYEPNYAVLINGMWGSGKTWFIKNFIKNHESIKKTEIIKRSKDQLWWYGENKEKSAKILYISLYGVATFDDIENEMFKQLCPILSSEKMILATKIARGVLKGTLKIDLDGDGKTDASISAQIPDIDLTKHLTNTNGFILIFDDLERASIDINKILGYINYFVEHNGYKAIIVANEDEILKNHPQINTQEIKPDSGHFIDYLRIKEKLIGKSFTIEPNVQKSLSSFIGNINKGNIKKLYESNNKNLELLFEISGYKNLRFLKMALWDFERLSHFIADNYLRNNDFILALAKVFFILSFEIKSGNIKIREIQILGDRRLIYSDPKKLNEIELKCKEITIKYNDIDFSSLIVDPLLWIDFLEKGSVDREQLNLSINNCPYFKVKNTPSWIKLWNFLDLDDNSFDSTLKAVREDFDNHRFNEIGELKHITGIFLTLSNAGIIEDEKCEILKKSFEYVDYLKSMHLLKSQKNNFMIDEDSYWNGLGFYEKDSSEFNELINYIKQKTHEATIEDYPLIASELLVLMKTNPDLFSLKITLSNNENNIYYDTPILQYIKPEDFTNTFLEIPSSYKKKICYAISRRYKIQDFIKHLSEEKSWLESVITNFQKSIKINKGKISSYQLSIYLKNYFLPALDELKSDQ